MCKSPDLHHTHICIHITCTLLYLLHLVETTKHHGLILILEWVIRAVVVPLGRLGCTQTLQLTTTAILLPQFFGISSLSNNWTAQSLNQVVQCWRWGHILESLQHHPEHYCIAAGNALQRARGQLPHAHIQLYGNVFPTLGERTQ